MFDKPTVVRYSRLIALLTVLSVVIGISCGILTLMLHWVEHLALGYTENAKLPGPFHVLPIRRTVSVIIGCTIAAAIWWWLRTHCKFIPSVSQAVSGKDMPWWQTTLHVLLQIFIVGCGTSIGREAAPRELGAMLGQKIGNFFHITAHEQRLVVAISAGAGLAGVYNAPFAGLFFAVEILLADMAVNTVVLALGASALTTYVANLIKGQEIFYILGTTKYATSWVSIFLALLVGVILGILGGIFRIFVRRFQKNRPNGKSILWLLPSAAIVTGIVAFFLPQIMGNGRAAAQFTFTTTHGTVTWQIIVFLLIVGIAKFSVTLFTIRSGASGGTLQPSISVGAIFGVAIGWLASFLFPQVSLTTCALLGAVGFLSASQQAPLMAMSLVIELTHAPMELYIPICLVGAICCFVSCACTHFELRTERKALLQVS